MKNEISEKKNTDIAVPSAFMDDAGSGLENIGAEDVTIPRLKILQAMSPEVNKHDGKYVDGASTGDIINTVTSTLYNDSNPLVVLPVAYKRLFLEWTPRESGGGLVAQHDDPAVLEKTTKNEQYQDVLENGNYIQTSATHFVLVINSDGSYDTAMISMAGTQLKRSRTWNSMMASVKMKSGDKVFTPPSFSHKYNLSCVQESNDRGTWFGWGITAKGQVTQDEMTYYEAAKTFAEQVGGINLSQTSANAETGEAPF
tara:strand:- start:1984 stop:2751 length:768 start_codon:yes stop_codon:yes gene_type:complete